MNRSILETGIFKRESRISSRRATLAGILALSIFGAWGLWKLAHSDSSSLSDHKAAAVLTTDLSASPAGQETQATLSTPASAPLGRKDPGTGLFYPFASPPLGFEDWDCFSIPPGQNSWGAIRVGGDSVETRYDSIAAVVFVYGLSLPPVEVDPQTDPKTWNPLVTVVQPQTVVCSR